MTNDERSPLAIGLALATLLALLGMFECCYDPFDWGKVVSKQFSWEKFSTIKVGDPIDKAVSLLGDPVWPPESSPTIVRRPGDPCDDGTCTRYVFSAARWGSTYREGIIIVDRNRRIVAIIDHRE
jgi:hypothetical protein